MMSSIEKLICQKTPIKDPITQPRPAKWNQSYLWDGTDARFVTRLFAYVSPMSQLFDRFSNWYGFSVRVGRSWLEIRTSGRLQLVIQPSVVTYSPELWIGGASKIARGTPTRRRARAPRTVSALRVSARVSRVSPSRRRPRPCSRVPPRVQGFAAPLTSVFSGAPKCLSGAAPSRPRTRPLPS